MSALRIARPGHPVILLDQGPAEGRLSRGHAGGAIVPVAEPWRVREARLAREATQAKAQQERRKAKSVDLNPASNLDNEGVQTSTTEVQR